VKAKNLVSVFSCIDRDAHQDILEQKREL